jgi:hypothetical protein
MGGSYLRALDDLLADVENATGTAVCSSTVA